MRPWWGRGRLLIPKELAPGGVGALGVHRARLPILAQHASKKNAIMRITRGLSLACGIAESPDKTESPWPLVHHWPLHVHHDCKRKRRPPPLLLSRPGAPPERAWFSFFLVDRPQHHQVRDRRAHRGLAQSGRRCDTLLSVQIQLLFLVPPPPSLSGGGRTTSGLPSLAQITSPLPPPPLPL